MSSMSVEKFAEWMGQEEPPALLDVRSQAEFALGHCPMAINVPILNDSHRHQVGLAYKRDGSESALRLGHELVDPMRSSLVSQWMEVLRRGEPQVVYCWRGGLRSQIATQWLHEAGQKEVMRLEGGYKALRKLVLSSFSQSPSRLLVLGGLTGSGKTELLSQLGKGHALDLELLARHRGSSFGRWLNQVQPTQQNFENSLWCSILKAKHEVVVESESRMIGTLVVPLEMFERMRQAPLVLLESSLEDRVQRIFAEYVASALSQNVSATGLAQFYQQALLRIRNRLGGALQQEISVLIEQAFSSPSNNLEEHRPWISSLLERYYDPLYHHSLSRESRPVIFRGSFKECHEFFSHRFSR